MARTSAFWQSKLEAALTTIDGAYTSHEGLYYAYVEHLQWLESERKELPAKLQALLDEFTCHGSDVRRENKARATVSSMSSDDALELIERIRALTLGSEITSDGAHEPEREPRVGTHRG